MQRRNLLKASMALAAFGFPAIPAIADDPHKTGKPFSFDTLKKRARDLAGQAYQSHAEQLPSALTDLSPEQFHQISMRPGGVLWGQTDHIDFQISLSHVGMHFNIPVRVNVVDPDSGRARRIDFSPDLFDYSGSGVAPAALAGKSLGFAGFDLSIKESGGSRPEIASFLGASYFRAVDSARQYGLSARGLAIDIDQPGGKEEFPNFVEYWFVRPSPDSQRITVYALLDSPSTTGAYRMDIGHGDKGVTMDIVSDLYPRKAIKRLGVAPMSSMFLKGVAQPEARDTIYRRMHDSDRLSMRRGNGEWICRPLYNPPTIQYNLFEDHNPKGFGLIQHNHDFNAYRNTVAWYNRRPSLWIEPKNDWGSGAVALLEMPTIGETVDNISVFWVPAKPVTGGDHLHYEYKLYWWPQAPVAPDLAAVDETHSGMGDVKAGWIPGTQPPEHYARRFAVDFKGGPLPGLAGNAAIAADVSASRGTIDNVVVRRLGPIDEYRAEFDWQPTTSSVAPITLRCYLHTGDRALTETWLYQWVPPKPGDRHY